MNKGVQILLERMESHPDEFYANSRASQKWRDIVEQIYQRAGAQFNDPDAKPHWKYLLHYLSDEEILKLRTKMQSIRADEFTKDVMGRLLAGADDWNYHNLAQPQSDTPNLNKAQASAERAHQYQQAETQAQADYEQARVQRQVFGNGK
jgi:hypothetical protein